MSTLLNQIKSAKANVFRRLYIKRRSATTGLYEDDWLEITSDVKTFGKISSKIDDVRPYKFTFGNVKFVVNNDSGRYNEHDSEPSLWFGYLNQQRTLVKIEAGFIETNRAGSGLITNNEFPYAALWDEALWDDDDEQALWDGTPNTVFTGIISGDISSSDKNDVAFNVKPLTSVFEEFAAKNLSGYTSTGLTASQFVTLLRDQTDGSGNYIFRPFFGNTTTNWEISTTANVFTVFNTNTSSAVADKTAWEVIEKLSEAENFVPFVTSEGVFRFVSRDTAFSASSFAFYGAGQFNSQYGQTIKSVDALGRKQSKYYSRVSIKYREEDTTTSYETVEAAFSVSPSSNPWVLGDRTLKIENLYFSTSTAAQAAAQTIFNEVSTLKKEISFKTSFVPGLDIFSIFNIYYDPASVNVNSLWDQNDWAADLTSTSTDLTWDRSSGDSVVLSGEEFKFLSFELDLDNMQNVFLAREE